MYVAELAVTNFRSLKSSTIRFRPDATVLVGPNNAGKTNVLRALQLCLGTDVTWQRDPISHFDFADGNRDEEFTITATLQGLTETDIHFFGIDNLEPVAEDGSIITEAPDISIVDERPLALRLTLIGSYDAETEEYSLTWYFTKHGEQRVPVTRQHRRYIGLQYVRGGDASAAWSLGLSPNSLIRRALRKQGGSLARELAQFAEVIDRMSRTLNDHGELSAVLSELREEINRVLPLTEEPLRFGVGRRGGEDLLRALELIATPADSSIPLPLSAHGRGSLSIAVLMSVLRHAVDTEGSLILALEEPEVALHPHMQRALLEELLRRNVQVILTTHSPVIAGACPPEQLVMVRKEGQQTTVRPLISQEERVDGSIENRFKKLLSESVFARAVLIVEGETDAAFLHAVDRTLAEREGWRTLDTEGVHIVEADSCSRIRECAQHLRRLQIPIFGLADNDPHQPEASVLDWGKECDHYFIWPRNPEAYDLEGVIAFCIPLSDLVAALGTVIAKAGNEQHFMNALVRGARKVGQNTLFPWVRAQRQNGIGSLGDLFDKWENEQHGLSEDLFRAAIKRAMEDRLKQRRTMRLLGEALDPQLIPQPVVDLLCCIRRYLDGGLGSGVTRLSL